MDNPIALATHIPLATWMDSSRSRRVFIGLTLGVFALFSISLVLIPQFAPALGLPAWC